MSTNRTSIVLTLIWLIVLLSHQFSLNCNAIQVRQREDNDVLYNEIEPNVAVEDHSEMGQLLGSVAKHMTHWLRSVVTEELGVTHMQQIYDTLNNVKHNINFETIIEDMTQKVCYFVIPWRDHCFIVSLLRWPKNLMTCRQCWTRRPNAWMSCSAFTTKRAKYQLFGRVVTKPCPQSCNSTNTSIRR